MTEILYQNRQFDLEPAKSEDAVAIGVAHLQSWVETYPNEELNITEEWIKSELAFLVEDQGIKFRENVINSVNEDTLYKVIKDEEGVVQGFVHADKDDDEVKLNAVYLTENLKGTGVSHRIMEDVIDFAGSLPISLQVVTYNERAIKFYEKYGFTKSSKDAGLFHDKIPLLNMKREASHEV